MHKPPPASTARPARSQPRHNHAAIFLHNLTNGAALDHHYCTCLVGVCVKISIGVHQLKIGAGSAKAKVAGVLNDVDGLRKVLQSLESTLDDVEEHEQSQATGHIGTHWEHLNRSLRDAQELLQDLQNFVEAVNKEVSVLDGSRRFLRIKHASNNLTDYQQHVRAYCDAIQFSVQTIVL